MKVREQTIRQVNEIRRGQGRLTGSLLRPVCIIVMSLLTVFASSLESALAQSSVKMDLSRIGDASHIEFSGTTEWKYDMKRTPDSPNKVTLRIRGLDSSSIEKLKSYTDSLIRGVTVNEQGVDGAVEILFDIVAHADFFDYLTDDPSRLIVDFFPKESSKTTKTETSAEIQSSAGKPSVNQPTQLPAKGAGRKPAGTDFVIVGKTNLGTTVTLGGGDASSSPKGSASLAEKLSAKKDFNHGIFDGGDPEFRRFSIKDYEIRPEAIEASQTNYYLPFPMLELGSKFLRSMLDNPPTYEIVENETQENKEARLILTLFSKKRRALTLKTGEQFLTSYPRSPYDEIIRYMMADTQFKLWKTQGTAVDFESAMGLYRYLTEKYPDSPVTPRTLLLMGYAYVDRGDSISALKAFQRFARMKPDSKHLDQVNVSIAEAYLKINRFDDAYGILDQIEKNGKTLRARHEAAFRKGDVYFHRKDFSKAIDAYKTALTKYPEAAVAYPNAWYNMAEAEFYLAKHRDSLDSYRKFVIKFPDHDYGGYAMTRMGELLDILGAPGDRATGAFFESYFRYRATPGAGIARIRLLSSRMKTMNDKELASALAEISDITNKYSVIQKPKSDENSKEKDGKKVAKTGAESSAQEKAAQEKAEGSEKATAENKDGESVESEVAESSLEKEEDLVKRAELPGIEEFSTLLIADGYTDRKEFDRSNKDLIAFYQANPHSANKGRMKARIVRNMTEAIQSSVQEGNFIDGLRRYSANVSGWLKNSGRADLQLYVGNAYEQAGVFKEATKVYQETLKNIQSRTTQKTDGKNDVAEARREPAIFENVPKPETLQLRLAAVAVKDRDYAAAEKALKSIPAKASLSEREQVERAEVSADVAEAFGQFAAAQKYLSDLLDTWKGHPELTSPVHLRMAKLLSTRKQYKPALTHVQDVINLRSKKAPVSDDHYARALELKGELLLKSGKRKQAIATYQGLLEEFEGSRPLESVRYRLGKIQYEAGDLKGAEATWAGLKGETQNVWRRLADEQMQGAKWQNEYKKYIERIPAAADLRSSRDPVTQ